MKYYKGFNKDMTCRGFQFKEGESYETDEAKLCERGFHACEYPLDCFAYYAPAQSEYHEVEVEDIADERSDDTKVVARRIKIGAKLSIANMVQASVEYIKEHIDNSKTQTNTGDWSVATNTGDWSVATNTGNWSVATNTGDWSVATNTGDWSVATNTGNSSAATNTGNSSAATNTGNWSVATNTGNSSAATNTGNSSVATNTGDWSVASVEGKDSVAIVTGCASKAKASLGSAICVCERGDFDGKTYPLLAIKAAIVDGETIKPDIWYTLKDGEFVEVNNETWEA